MDRRQTNCSEFYFVSIRRTNGSGKNSCDKTRYSYCNEYIFISAEHDEFSSVGMCTMYILKLCNFLGAELKIERNVRMEISVLAMRRVKDGISITKI